MKIVQQSKNNFAPIVQNIERDVTITTGGSTVPITVGSLNAFSTSGDVYHYMYNVYGINIESDVSLYSEPINSIDFSDWPSIRRSEGYNGYSRFFISNGKSTYRSKDLAFITLGNNESFNVGPVTVIPGTYADYSRQRVLSLCDAMPDNRVLENANANNRVNTEIFPHAAFTGICTHGGWPSQYIGGGIEGRRPVAITKRHVWNCGHYSSDIQVGNVLLWKTVDNQTVSRTVIQKINIFVETGGYVDAAIYLLDYDLPDTIKPLPIVGDWLYNFSNITEENFSMLPQCYGLTLWGNDGQFSPSLSLPLNDIVWDRKFYYPQTGPANINFENIILDKFNIIRVFNMNYSSFWESYENLPQYLTTTVGGKFYHYVTGGDSGSPIVVPVEDGWALCGIFSSNAHGSPETFNALINRLDIRAGISTGYTVTVASNPLAP